MVPHAEGTIVFIIAHVTSEDKSAPILLEATHMYAVEGDPGSPGYNTSYRSLDPIIVAIRYQDHLPSSIAHTSNLFAIHVDDYVCNHHQKTWLMCVCCSLTLSILKFRIADVDPTTISCR